MNSVNLIPRKRLESAARAKRARAWLFTLGGCAVVCISASVAVRVLWSVRNDPIRAQIAATRAAIAETDAAVLKVRGEIAGLRRADLAARMVGDHPDWSVLLRAVNGIRGDGVSLETIELKAGQAPPPAAAKPGEAASAQNAADRYELRLKGIATELAGVMEFINRLESLGVLERVVMKESRSELKHGVAITGFDIQCELAESRATGNAGSTASAEAAGENK